MQRTASAETPYEGAARGRRVADWTASGSGPTSLVTGNATTVRNRVRDQVRNNPHAAAALESYTANVVGTGLRPQSLHEDTAIRAEIEKKWGIWAEQTRFYGQQTGVVRAERESGEVFVRMRRRRSTDGLVVPMQCELLEADFVPLEQTIDQSRDRTVKAGIVFDPTGRRTAYLMYRSHPGESGVQFGASGSDLARVSADDVVHVYEPKRPGQIRGMSPFAPVLFNMRQLYRYQDAELERLKTSAMFAAFIYTLTEHDLPLPETGRQPAGTKTKPSAKNPALSEQQTIETALTPLEPALMQVVPRGWDIKFADPPDTGGNFADYLKVNLRAIAAALNVPYAAVTGDWTETNFSTSRSEVLEYRRRWEAYQAQTLITGFTQIVWRRWIREGMLAGSFQPANISQARLLGLYNDDPTAFEAASWSAPPWPWVDPLKDVQAQKMEIRVGMQSRSGATRARGRDPEQIENETARDNERADQKQLVFDSDGRYTDAGGAASDQPQGAGAEESNAAATKMPLLEDLGEGERVQ